jgi:hypothetical protein
MKTLLTMVLLAALAATLAGCSDDDHGVIIDRPFWGATTPGQGPALAGPPAPSAQPAAAPA